MKQRIKLTETDLHNIIKESTKRLLKRINENDEFDNQEDEVSFEEMEDVITHNPTSTYAMSDAFQIALDYIKVHDEELYRKLIRMEWMAGFNY